MGILSIVTIFIVFMLGYVITGLVGFGGNVLILPILSVLDYSVHDIVVVMAFVSFFNALYRVSESREAIIWIKLVKLWCITLPGALMGVWLLKNLPEETLKLFLGIFIIVLGLFNLIKKHEFVSLIVLQNEGKIKKLLYSMLLFVGSVLQGAFVCGGPLYVIYCSHYFGHERAKYRGMQFGVMVLNSFVVFLSYWVHGDYVNDVAVQCIPALLGIGAAVFISGRLLKKINDSKLYILIQLVLIVSGSNLVVQFF